LGTVWRQHQRDIRALVAGVQLRPLISKLLAAVRYTFHSRIHGCFSCPG